MKKRRLIVIGKRESFIAMVLVKKAKEAGADASFVPWTVNEINANAEDVSLVVLYMEDDERPPEETLHYLTDVLEEKEMKLIICGGQREISFACDHIKNDLIFKSFPRPVDHGIFMETIADYFRESEKGAFKKSILIVDDDPQYLTMIREWLRGTYNVSMANSGLQAIKMLGIKKVDLILLDHEMPVTSGPQVLEMLRNDVETASIPVMFLTGKGDKNSVMQVIELKPEGYFLKGIQKEELLEKLQEYFILHK